MHVGGAFRDPADPDGDHEGERTSALGTFVRRLLGAEAEKMTRRKRPALGHLHVNLRLQRTACIHIAGSHGRRRSLASLFFKDCSHQPAQFSTHCPSKSWHDVSVYSHWEEWCGLEEATAARIDAACWTLGQNIKKSKASSVICEGCAPLKATPNAGSNSCAPLAVSESDIECQCTIEARLSVARLKLANPGQRSEVCTHVHRVFLSLVCQTLGMRRLHESCDILRSRSPDEASLKRAGSLLPELHHCLRGDREPGGISCKANRATFRGPHVWQFVITLESLDSMEGPRILTAPCEL